MIRKIALDLDGTLVSYGWDTNNEPIINHTLLQQLKDEGVTQIDICTNQAGIVFGYRSPESFVKVIDWLSRVVYNDYRIEIDSVGVSLYHEKADMKRIGSVCGEFDGLFKLTDCPIYIWVDAESRKPNPDMLRISGCTEYWGDSPEDKQAALAAGKIYRQVERFTKEWL